MVRENLAAERIVIDIYREMIICLGESDPTTRRLIEKILAEEEEHADDLLKFLPRNERRPSDEEPKKKAITGSIQPAYAQPTKKMRKARGNRQ